MRTPRLSRLSLASVALAGSLVLAACGGPSSEPDQEMREAGGAIPTATSESLVDPATKEGKLVWYTSNTRPTADAISAEFEKTYPGIDVEVFQAGGSQVIAKVEAEAMSGQIKADIVDYSESAAAEGQARRGLFQRYQPEGVDEISNDLLDERGYWFPPYFLTATIVYNNKLLSESEAPTSWAELTEPKWKNKVGMGSPDYAGTALAIVGAWRDEFGEDYLTDLGENGLTVFEGFGNVHDAVLSGQTPVAVNLSFRALMAEKEGQPMSWITPEEGQILLSSSAAIPAKAEHPNAAKLFANFLVSENLQTLVARDAGYFPVRNGVADKLGMPDTSEFNLFKADLERMADPKQVSDLKSLFKNSVS